MIWKSGTCDEVWLLWSMDEGGYGKAFYHGLKDSVPQVPHDHPIDPARRDLNSHNLLSMHRISCPNDYKVFMHSTSKKCLLPGRMASRRDEIEQGMVTCDESSGLPVRTRGCAWVDRMISTRDCLLLMKILYSKYSKGSVKPEEGV